IDAIDLVLMKRSPDAAIERARRLEAVAEGLLDQHTAPAAALAVAILGLVGEPGVAGRLHARAAEAGGNGDVEDDSARPDPAVRVVPRGGATSSSAARSRSYRSGLVRSPWM